MKNKAKLLITSTFKESDNIRNMHGKVVAVNVFRPDENKMISEDFLENLIYKIYKEFYKKYKSKNSKIFVKINENHITFLECGKGDGLLFKDSFLLYPI